MSFNTCLGCGIKLSAKNTTGYCMPCRDIPYRKEYQQAYYAEHREKLRTRANERYYANYEHEKEQRRRYAHKAKLDAINAYGGKCACCGETRWEFLAIDHINGGGKQHRKNAASVGGSFYRWLRREGFPQGELRVLCHNCNQAHGLYHYCPHERERQEITA